MWDLNNPPTTTTISPILRLCDASVSIFPETNLAHFYYLFTRKKEEKKKKKKKRGNQSTQEPDHAGLDVVQDVVVAEQGHVAHPNHQTLDWS